MTRVQQHRPPNTCVTDADGAVCYSSGRPHHTCLRYHTCVNTQHAAIYTKHVLYSQQQQQQQTSPFVVKKKIVIDHLLSYYALLTTYYTLLLTIVQFPIPVLYHTLETLRQCRKRVGKGKHDDLFSVLNRGPLKLCVSLCPYLCPCCMLICCTLDCYIGHFESSNDSTMSCSADSPREEYNKGVNRRKKYV